MNIKIFVILLYILTLTGLVVAQESVAVFEFKAVGLDEQTTEAACRSLKMI